eukprot:8469144-Pyramimonas_sp.AAC.1
MLANTGDSNVRFGFAAAAASSFLSPAHAASPRPHARHERASETNFPVVGSPFHCDVTPIFRYV